VIELIDTFVRPLVSSGLPYAVTGSVAAMAYGEPRLTNDIDLVLQIRVDDIPRLAQAFPESDFYLPPPEVIDHGFLGQQLSRQNLTSEYQLAKDLAE